MAMGWAMEILQKAWWLFSTASGALCLVSGSLYLAPLLYLGTLGGVQNVKNKYGATWALVTGGSSGIGKAVVRKLASQGINVCVVGLDDALMTATMDELRRDFTGIAFISIAVDLGRRPEAYMRTICEATAELPISVVVNNAGYLIMGFFHERSMEAHAANIECNQGAAVRITHHFYSRMVREKRRGCICFTSSAVLFMPAPFASMYGATKAFLSHFATSLAVEAESHGIDVSVFHPSFTHTNLYAKTPKFGVINVLAKFGATPEHVADIMLSSVGRVIVRDAGMYAVSTNILGRIVDAGALAKFIIPFRDSMAPPGAIKAHTT